MSESEASSRWDPSLIPDPTAALEAQLPNPAQPLHHFEKVGGRGGPRRLPQPDEQGLTGGSGNREERLELCALEIREPFRQQAKDLPLSAAAHFPSEPFYRRDARNDDLALTHFLDESSDQLPVVLADHYLSLKARGVL